MMSLGGSFDCRNGAHAFTSNPRTQTMQDAEHWTVVFLLLRDAPVLRIAVLERTSVRMHVVFAKAGTVRRSLRCVKIEFDNWPCSGLRWFQFGRH